MNLTRLATLLLTAFGISLAIVTFNGAQASASAQPMVVRIKAETLDVQLPSEPAASNTPAKKYQRITALAGGKICASADLRNNRDQGYVVLQIGLPNQPAECSQDNATISFAFGTNAEWRLTSTVKFQAGVTTELQRLGVEPPESGETAASGGQVRAPSTGSGGIANDSGFALSAGVLLAAAAAAVLLAAGGLMIKGSKRSS
jgi:hypothetical protein